MHVTPNRASPLTHRSIIACLLFATIAGLAPQAYAAGDGDVRWLDTTATIAAEKAGWGRMAQLRTGDWLAVTTRFDEGAPSTLALSLSRDGARSWSPLASLAEPGRKLDNGELLALPNGQVLLAMRSLIDGQSYRLNLYRSDDDGRSWRFLATLDRNEAPAGHTDRGVWEPVLSLLPDGTLSVLYADETLADGAPGHAQVVSQRLSSDGGASWGSRNVIVAQPGGGSARPGMPVMARLQDGRHLLVFEICGDDPQCPVSIKFSEDGRHWPQGLGEPLPPHNCGPHVLATAEGRVLVTSCQNEISWSEDGGNSWHRIDPPAWTPGFRHSWPALYQTGPGEIAVVNNDGAGAVRVRFGRFAPATGTDTTRKEDATHR